MFESLSVKQLKTLITEFKAFHDIKGYHRMKKDQLVKELGKRFVLKNGRLHTTEDDDDDAPLWVAPKSKSAKKAAAKPDIVLVKAAPEPEKRTTTIH